MLQFDPELFVDGLLGIGAAGGKGASSSEGAMLASRLAEMRKERDLRALTKAKEAVAPVASTILEGASYGRSNRQRNSTKKKRKTKK